MNTIKPVLFLLLVATFFSCRKLIQQQEERAVMTAITNGYWYVSQYLKNGTDITASFSGYLFKFDANGTVTGTRDSTAQKGTWAPNIDARTIVAGFPSATEPLIFLNATWKIRDSRMDFVSAGYINSATGESFTLELKKK